LFHQKNWRIHARAKAFVFAAEEDFGILPLEDRHPDACHCIGQGGALETVRVSQSLIRRVFSLILKQQMPFVRLLEKFEEEQNKFTENAFQKQVAKFTPEIFRENLKKFIHEKISE